METKTATGANDQARRMILEAAGALPRECESVLERMEASGVLKKTRQIFLLGWEINDIAAQLLVELAKAHGLTHEEALDRFVTK